VDGYTANFANQKSFLTWLVLKGQTKNTAGVVEAVNTNPFAMPDINFHYFEEGTDPSNSDADAVAVAVDWIRKQADKTKLITMLQETVPGRQVQGPALKTWIRNEAWGHHACCTARMGRADDPNAVLDGNFNVIGTQRLRVVDASIFPKIPGFFIVLPIYMAAEKAADVIHADAVACPTGPRFTEADASVEHNADTEATADVATETVADKAAEQAAATVSKKAAPVAAGVMDAAASEDMAVHFEDEELTVVDASDVDQDQHEDAHEEVEEPREYVTVTTFKD
jgi:hypothetical protein